MPDKFGWDNNFGNSRPPNNVVRLMSDEQLAELDTPEAKTERTRRLVSLDGDIGRRTPRI